MGTITRKLQKAIDYLGWEVEPTYEALFRYLMEKKEMYVLARPLPYGKWMSTIVLLIKPNTQDGLMNAVDVEGTMKTYDEAIKKGVELAVEIRYDALREVRRMATKPNFAEMIKELKEEMIKNGFDL